MQAAQSYYTERASGRGHVDSCAAHNRILLVAVVTDVTLAILSGNGKSSG